MRPVFPNKFADGGLVGMRSEGSDAWHVSCEVHVLLPPAFLQPVDLRTEIGVLFCML